VHATFAPIVRNLVALAAAGVAHAQGALLVVDATGGPGSAFTSIADAVSAAVDGDTLLVRSGTYAPFTIDGLTLVVAAEPGASVVVDLALLGSSFATPAATVTGIAANQGVVLAGLTLKGTQPPGNDNGGYGLRVDGCGGQVWIQDCEIVGGANDVFDRHGAYVTDSSQVLFVRSQVTGTSYLSLFGINHIAAGLRAIDSSVYAWESGFTGGAGGPGAYPDGGFFFAEGSVLQGGPGEGVPGPAICQLQVDGGPGLKLFTFGSKATLFDTHPLGGEADPEGCSADGPNTSVLFGQLTQLPGSSASFAVTSPVLDGASTTLTFAGQPGDLPVVLMAMAWEPVAWFSKYSGALVTGHPALFLLSPLPASGTLSVPFGFGDALAPGTGGIIYLQGAVLKVAGGALLADPGTLITFDD